MMLSSALGLFLSGIVKHSCILCIQCSTKVFLLSFSKVPASYCPWWKLLGEYCPQRKRNMVPIAGTVKLNGR